MSKRSAKNMIEKEIIPKDKLTRDLFPHIPHFASAPHLNTRSTKNISLKEFAHQLVERLQAVADEERVGDHIVQKKQKNNSNDSLINESVNIFASTICHKEVESHFCSPLSKIDSTCPSLATRESPRYNSSVSGKFAMSSVSEPGSASHGYNTETSDKDLRKHNDGTWSNLPDLFDWIEICDKRMMDQYSPNSNFSAARVERVTQYNLFTQEDIDRIKNMAEELSKKAANLQMADQKKDHSDKIVEDIPDLILAPTKLIKYSEDDSSGIQTMHNHSDELDMSGEKDILLAYFIDSESEPYVAKVQVESDIVLLQDVKNSIPRNVKEKRFFIKTFDNSSNISKSRYVEWNDDSLPIPVHNNKIICRIY